MKLVSFELEAIQNIKCMQDFFEIVGLMPMIINREITNIDQIWMNTQQCENLLTLIKSNLRKDKKWKKMNDHTRQTAAAIDWANYSPFSDDNVQPNTLVIYTNEELVEAKKQHRNSIQNH